MLSASHHRTLKNQLIKRIKTLAENLNDSPDDPEVLELFIQLLREGHENNTLLNELDALRVNLEPLNAFAEEFVINHVHPRARAIAVAYSIPSNARLLGMPILMLMAVLCLLAFLKFRCHIIDTDNVTIVDKGIKAMLAVYALLATIILTAKCLSSFKWFDIPLLEKQDAFPREYDGGGILGFLLKAMLLMPISPFMGEQDTHYYAQELQESFGLQPTEVTEEEKTVFKALYRQYCGTEISSEHLTHENISNYIEFIRGVKNKQNEIVNNYKRRFQTFMEESSREETPERRRLLASHSYRFDYGSASTSSPKVDRRLKGGDAPDVGSSESIICRFQ